jgi:glutaconate CoA-transferase subunit B
LYDGVSVEQARAATGWDLAVAEELRATAPPTAHELDALRELVSR